MHAMFHELTKWDHFQNLVGERLPFNDEGVAIQMGLLMKKIHGITEFTIHTPMASVAKKLKEVGIKLVAIQSIKHFIFESRQIYFDIKESKSDVNQTPSCYLFRLSLGSDSPKL